MQSPRETRAQIKERSAVFLNSLTRDELFLRWGITRIARIDGLDCVHVPVYASCVPGAKVLSTCAGKGRFAHLARAGAVAEAIEFSTFENPVGPFGITPFHSVDPDLLPVYEGSGWTPDTFIAREKVTHYSTGELRDLPSELIWMTGRSHKKLRQKPYFQMSSNGQAVGTDFQTAFLHALYEVVERDQAVLRMISWEKLGVQPPRVDLARAPESIRGLHQATVQAGLKLYVSKCSADITLPVYWAILIDPDGFGNFAGWGCDYSEEKAAERAILESIQSRAVYISGARDDILRRDFAKAKSLDVKMLIAEQERIEPTLEISSLPEIEIEAEIERAVEALGPHVENLYFKHLDLGDLHAVKVIVLGFEQPRVAGWKSIRWKKLHESYSQAQAFTETAPAR